MVTINCDRDYDAVLQFLRSDPMFSYSMLLHVVEKLKMRHPALDQTILIVDDPANIGVVVTLHGNAIATHPLKPYKIGIVSKDSDKLRDFYASVSDTLFPSDAQVLLCACFESVVKLASGCMVGHQILVKSSPFLYYKPKSSNTAIEPACPVGYSYGN